MKPVRFLKPDGFLLVYFQSKYEIIPYFCIIYEVKTNQL